MGRRVNINRYYFTGLQYNSKRVLPNYLQNVGFLVNVQAFYSSLEALKAEYNIFIQSTFILYLAIVYRFLDTKKTTLRKSALLPFSDKMHQTYWNP